MELYATCRALGGSKPPTTTPVICGVLLTAGEAIAWLNDAVEGTALLLLGTPGVLLNGVLGVLLLGLAAGAVWFVLATCVGSLESSDFTNSSVQAPSIKLETRIKERDHMLEEALIGKFLKFFLSIPNFPIGCHINQF